MKSSLKIGRVRSLFILLCFLSLFETTSGRASHLSNPGFEQTQLNRAANWAFYQRGYSLDRAVHRSGAVSIRCENRSQAEARGAMYTLVLNQKQPSPVVVTGWSRAVGVSGSPDPDYSLYVDLEFMDGTPLWGQSAAFDTGTHGWQKKRVLILPDKPIRKASLYVLFRHHTGTAWFDDVSAVEMNGKSLFDSQVLAPPRLAPGSSGGWFARDVARNTPILPLLDSTGQPSTESRRLHLRFTPSQTRLNAPLIGGTLEDASGHDRAVTLYYVERFPAAGSVWWDDLHRFQPTKGTGEWSHLTRTGAGAVGSQSLYPFGCVTNGRRGRGLGIPPDIGPKIARIGYHAGSGLLYLAFDLSLTDRNTANRNHAGHGTAKVAVARFAVDPQWGFRSAADRYYRLFPKVYRRLARAEGIWIPFTDPSKVEGVKDFGIAYHEGDNSVSSDDHLGILSFRYTEPMTYWLSMPVSVPRTYTAALAMIHQQVKGKDIEKRRWAEAVLSSGSQDSRGRFNVEFRNTPWANGAVFALNPNPHLRPTPGLTTKAQLNYSAVYANRAYSSKSNGQLDGEYLDSIEGWANVLDYRPESIRDALYPPTFDTDTFRSVLPTWFSVYEEAEWMGHDLHRRGKLLMANATPWNIFAFSPLLDVMGTETDWLSNHKQWEPEADAIMCYRRTLSGQKPYLLLQNTDFDAFGPYVEHYFRRCLFYGIYPSFFSIDAANHPYWETPRWYNRDRPLFQRYIPLIQRLSAAGWEPIPYARTNDSRVYIERFGARYLTLLNDSENTRKVTLTLAPDFLKRANLEGKQIEAMSLLPGADNSPLANQGSLRFVLTLPPGETTALEIRSKG